MNALVTFKEVGAIRKGHFVLKSGRHSDCYVNKDMIFLHPDIVSMFCASMANSFKDDAIDVVIGPVIGGVILSHLTAFHLSEMTGREVLSAFAEKDGDGFIIKRGYPEFISGKRVLVVEDVLTTGGSVKKVAEEIRKIGGIVAGVAALCDRGAVSYNDVGNPEKFICLFNYPVIDWDEESCPLCMKGTPINTDVGKGKEYLEKKGETAS